MKKDRSLSGLFQSARRARVEWERLKLQLRTLEAHVGEHSAGNQAAAGSAPHFPHAASNFRRVLAIWAPMSRSQVGSSRSACSKSATVRAGFRGGPREALPGSSGPRRLPWRSPPARGPLLALDRVRFRGYNLLSVPGVYYYPRE